MFTKYILLLFFILIFLQTTSAISRKKFNCVSTENCHCAINTKNDDDIWCEDSGYIINIASNITHVNEVIFQCSNKTSEWKVESIPWMELGDIFLLKIINCPHDNEGFEKLLKKMGIESVFAFSFSFPSTNTSINLDSSFFGGLKNLSSLYLRNNKIKSIKRDTFINNKDLKKIDLSVNEIEEIPDVFNSIPNILILDLSENLLSNLGDGFSDNLGELLELYLWHNNLTYIKPEVFQNLKKVEVLDLMKNNMEKLHKNTFANMSNLKIINLSINNLKEIPGNLFRSTRQLKEIRLGRNYGLTLSGGLFKNLSELESVLLPYCNLKEIPEDTFQGCHNLKEIDLSYNLLETIPEYLFKNLLELNILKLNNNKIKELSNNLFASLIRLNHLKLQNNSLESVGENVFVDLRKLEELDLSYNNLENLDRVFHSLEELQELNLNNNKLKNISEHAFSSLIKLKSLYIAANQLEEISTEILNLCTLLELVDYSNNKISYIDSYIFNRVSSNNVYLFLNNNKIRTIDLTFVTLMATINENSNKMIVYLDNNPINCDCNMYDLSLYYNKKMNPKVYKFIELELSTLFCASPPRLLSKPVINVSSDMLTCLVTEETFCPDNCSCSKRPFDKTFIVDCSNKSLDEVPKLSGVIPKECNQTEVHLEYNNLNSIPENETNLSNVTKMYLFHNSISKLHWLPSKIEVLDLHQNKLQNIDYKILEQLNSSHTLKNISLHENPWICNCDATNLTNFIREQLFYKKIVSNNIRCKSNGKMLMNLNSNDLCKAYTKEILVVIIILAIITTMSALACALYFKYKHEIKVWLFSHSLFLWWVTEDEVDKNKIYDAFISYSHQDEDFVANKLVPILEEDPFPYKLCLHQRDWVPGELIVKQIVKSVEQSKRTIIILSPHFLESVWGKMEFRTAHTSAMKEGRARVIVIIYGDIDLNENIDVELKAYLKTNTYVKWDDPWFWDKLRYALPHAHARERLKSKKVANIMMKIDKADLINGSGPKSVETVSGFDLK